MKRNINQHKAENEPNIDDILNEDSLTDNESNVEEIDSETENSDDQLSELDKLQQKYDDLNDSYLRLNAEFDNFRKRTVKEKVEIIKSGGERVLQGIITLVDDFERGLSVLDEAEDKSSMVEGMELIYNKFINFFRNTY